MTELESSLIYPLAAIGAITIIVVYSVTLVLTIKLWRTYPRRGKGAEA